MKKLTKDLIERKSSLEATLRRGGERLTEAIFLFNEQLNEAWAAVEVAKESYNDALRSVEEFTTEVCALQEEYKDARGDRWQDSDSGALYDAWAGEWQHTFAEVDLDDPQEMDIPDLNALEVLESLPLQP